MRKPYLFPLMLFSAIFLGGLTGYYMGKQAIVLKPLGDIFLNLIFTALIPLIFFSISSAVARLGKSNQLANIIFNMGNTFIFTGIIAALFMLLVVKLFPPANGMTLPVTVEAQKEQISILQQLARTITVPEFGQLLSHKNILPLLLVSLLVGLATSKAGEEGDIFAKWLQAGAAISLKITTILMYYAPIGFFAYFAVLIGDIGSQLLNNYLRIFVIYYTAGIIYFLIGFSFYAYLSNTKNGISIFWKNILVSIMTSIATCSSAATIPTNLKAAKQMGVPDTISETVIPIGAIIHKDGSVLGAIIKIAFLFGLFHMNLFIPTLMLSAIFISLLVGLVMGAMPGGGMMGEILILSLYGFPPQLIVIIAAIGLMIDPLATMLNSTGDVACSMMVSRLVNIKESDELTDEN